MFTINWVRVINDQGVVSTVEFGLKLNIIIDHSNCGKTMILKCIDYLFGAATIPMSINKYHHHKVEMKSSPNTAIFCCLGRSVKIA